MGATKFLYIHIKIFTKFAIYVNGESSHSECVNAGQRKCNWKMSAAAMALLTIVGSSKVCATVCVCVRNEHMAGRHEEKCHCALAFKQKIVRAVNGVQRTRTMHLN